MPDSHLVTIEAHLFFYGLGRMLYVAMLVQVVEVAVWTAEHPLRLKWLVSLKVPCDVFVEYGVSFEGLRWKSVSSYDICGINTWQNAASDCVSLGSLAISSNASPSRPWAMCTWNLLGSRLRSKVLSNNACSGDDEYLTSSGYLGKDNFI